MHRFTSRAATAVASALSFVVATSHAQYSADATAPFAVQATASDDVQPKFAAAPDGGKYVSFLSGSGYDVMLARLDASGNAVWKPQSIVVADRTNSSTTDYGLASDAAGNAYIAFDGMNGATAAIFVQAVTPSGALSWKTVVSDTAAGMVGRVAVASDGAVWACHLDGAVTRVQRLDATTGARTLPASTIISETGATQISADIQPSSAGTVIVSCVRYTTFTGAKVLRAHKINLNGTKPWAATGVPVFSTGSIQIGNFPAFISDGSGGAYFTWYTTTPLQSFVQRVTDAGAVMYGANGISVTSTTTNMNRVNPTSVLGGDGRLYTFWSQQVPNSSNYGIFGQCFAKGARVWGNDGAPVVPMSTTSYSRDFATAVNIGTGAGCFYVDNASAVTGSVSCARMTNAGAVEWTTPIATNTGVKYRLSSASTSDDGALLCWQGGSSGASDVSAARVGIDGVLGAPANGVLGDLNDDGVVDAADLAIMLGSWGASGAADLDGNGMVDAADLAILLGAWSPA